MTGARRLTRGVFAAALLLTTAAARAQAPGLAVEIVAPRAVDSVFGPTLVRLRVSGPARRAEIFLDGIAAASAAPPNWSATVDFGGENVAHRLEAVVYDAARGSASATVQLAAVAAELEIKVGLQQLYVTAEHGGSALEGLRREDFTVTDDGEPQTLVTFERGQVPLTATLLLDASASMSGGRLTTALDGARAFVRSLARLDEAKFLLFNDRLRVETPFTGSIAMLAVSLGDVTAGGGTALNDALFLALERLESRQGRKVIVLLSDGIDVESVLSMVEVRALARHSSATIYWLRMRGPANTNDGRVSLRSPWRGPEQHRRELELLQRTVEESGGRVDDIGGVSEVEAALARLLRELRAQYALGYYPSTSHGAGTWHDVRVELAGPGTARAQRGYVEP